jgi:hypothetical protein
MFQNALIKVAPESYLNFLSLSGIKFTHMPLFHAFIPAPCNKHSFIFQGLFLLTLVGTVRKA